jgi:hypothetical protein
MWWIVIILALSLLALSLLVVLPVLLTLPPRLRNSPVMQMRATVLFLTYLPSALLLLSIAFALGQALGGEPSELELEGMLAAYSALALAYAYCKWTLPLLALYWQKLAADLSLQSLDRRLATLESEARRLAQLSESELGAVTQRGT